MPPASNRNLPPLPSHEEIVTALRAYELEGGYGMRCTQLAGDLGVLGAKRLGRGAVKGSWSGTCSPSLRLAPRLSSMVKAGLLDSFWEKDYSMRYTDRYYATTQLGRDLIGG